MTTVAFTIPGKIHGKGRARMFKSASGALRSYTPEKTRSIEAVIRDMGATAMRCLDLAILEGPVEMRIAIWRVPPPSWSKKRRATARFICGKPDLDNIQALAPMLRCGGRFDPEADLRRPQQDRLPR